MKNTFKKDLKMIGSILVETSSYESTSNHFYLVVGLKGKTTLVLQPIGKENTEYYGNGIAGEQIPCPDVKYGEIFTARWNGTSANLKNGRSRCYLWNGKPLYWSAY